MSYNNSDMHSRISKKKFTSDKNNLDSTFYFKNSFVFKKYDYLNKGMGYSESRRKKLNSIIDIDHSKEFKKFKNLPFFKNENSKK